jgi:hypothetical protein
MSIDNRRSPRVVKRIPLRIDLGVGETLDAYSAVINLHGALVIAEQGFPDDTVLVLENVFNNLKTRARVVWSGGESEGSGFKLGVEFLDGVDFWGDDYDPTVDGDA